MSIHFRQVPGYLESMPELRNEVPSDRELAAYLDDLLKSSSVSLLADYPNNQGHYHSDLVEGLADLSSCPIRSEFLDVLKNSLLFSLFSPAP